MDKSKILGYRFDAKADGKTASIYIYGEVGWDVVALDIAKRIKSFEGEELEVRINSVGGSCFEASAIFNAIKEFKGRKTAYIDGLSASAATYIMLACDTVKAYENAGVFVHNPLVMWATGNSKDFEKIASELRKIEAQYVKAYVDKTGKEESEVRIVMDAETLFTAEEAREFGLVDEVISSGEEQAANARRKCLIAASYFLSEKFKAQGREGNNQQRSIKMKYGKWTDAIADLEALASKIEDESQKTELQEIIDGLKALAEEPETPEPPAEPSDKGDDAIEALRKEYDAKLEEMRKNQEKFFAQGFNGDKKNAPEKTGFAATKEAYAAKYLKK